MKPLAGGLASVVLMSTCVFLAGCGDVGTGAEDGPVGTGMNAKATIDSEGGQIELEEVLIEVPPGALAQGTEITVTSTKENPKGPYKRNSPVYKFEPDGLTFSVPVSVRLKWITTPEGTPQMFWTDSTGTFQPIGGIVGSGEVRVEVTHFSKGFVGTLAPNSSELDEDVPDVETEEPPLDVPLADPGSDTVDPEDSVQGETSSGYRLEILLLIDTSQPVNVAPNESFEIRAKVADLAGGAPVSGQTVSFQILNVEDGEGQKVAAFDGMLDASTVTTDANGIATTLFRAGTSCDLKYTLGLHLPGEAVAEPKSLDVIVGCEPCGCANLSFTYDGPLPASTLEGFKIYALPSDYPCSLLAAGQPVPEEAAWAVGDVESLFGTTSFECLPADTAFTMYALGHRKGSPCVVTTGCNDAVSLPPDTCQDIQLEMFVATMSPEGEYNCVDRFDFANVVKLCAGGDTSLLQCAASSDVLGENVCCLLAETIKFFKTPGQTIIDTINDLAAQWLGGLIADQPTLDLFKDAVAQVVTNWLLNDSPSFVQDFFTIGGDMFGAISSIELTSSMVMPDLEDDATLQGDQHWRTLTLHWKRGCDPMAPGYDECGRISLDLESLNNPLFPAAVLNTTFSASVVDLDRLIINQRSLPLNYGRLVLFVMNEVIVKTISGGQAGTLKEAAKLWIGCQSISQGIFGEVSSWFSGTRTDIEDLCSSAVDVLFEDLDVFINAMSLDTHLVISSTARLVDGDCNLTADQISEGRSAGFVQGSSTQQAAITGDFTCAPK